MCLYGAVWVRMALPNTSMGPPHTCGSGRFEELSNLIRTIRNAMKIRDVTRCLEEFELLGRAYAKARGVLDKEGVPRFYVRLLADLEDYLNEVWGGMWGWGHLPPIRAGLWAPTAG